MHDNSGVFHSNNKFKHTIVRLIVSALILAAVYVLESQIDVLLRLLVKEDLAYVLFLLLFVAGVLVTIYYAHRTYVLVTLHVIGKLSNRASMRPILPVLLLFDRVLGLVIAFVAALSLLSIKIPLLYGLLSGVLSSFSGLFSMLVALIVALQVKEIVGNYIAYIVIRSSGYITDQEFLCIGDEYLKVERVDRSHTLLVNRFGEEIYIPNLRFLIEGFRKPFSKKNIRYIELRFSLPYGYQSHDVKQRVARVIEQHNSQVEEGASQIVDHRLLVLDLASYAVLYELQVRPASSVFPEALRSGVRRWLHEEFGEDLATPAMLKINK